MTFDITNVARARATVKELHDIYITAEKVADDATTEAFKAAERSDQNKGYTNQATTAYELSIAAGIKAEEAKDNFTQALKHLKNLTNQGEIL